MYLNTFKNYYDIFITTVNGANGANNENYLSISTKIFSRCQQLKNSFTCAHGNVNYCITRIITLSSVHKIPFHVLTIRTLLLFLSQ